MENKVFEKNIAKISSYNKSLANKISAYIGSLDDFNVTKTKKDEYNLAYKNFLIHDDSGAVDEVNNIIQKINDKENQDSITIIYGLGLGYLADEASKVIKGKIVIYEPNIALLKYVLIVAEIDALYKDNVYICSNYDELSDLIYELCYPNTSMSVAFLNYHKQLYFDDIKKVLTIAQEAQGEKIANKNTLIKKAPQAILETVKNLKYIVKNPSISDISDIYKDKTALVLSSGASLAENIDIIKENKDKFIIFAINSNVKLLNQNGIIPDFIVNIEAKNVIEQYKDVDTTKSCFILEAFSNSKITQLKSKNTFNYISDINFLNPWLKDALDIKDNLITYGTVSFTAFMSAYIMGFKRIILCGQDLAYKDGNCYSKGSHFDDLACVYDEESKKYVIRAIDFDKFVQKHKIGNMSVQTAEKYALAHLNFFNKNIYTVKSQEGKDIPTQTGYALFIKYFSDIASYVKKQKNNNIELINASFGGAQIDGFENKKLENIVSGLEPVEKIDLTQYRANYNLDKLNQKISLMQKGLDEFLELIDGLEQNVLKISKEYKNKKIITPNMEKLINKSNDIIIKIKSLKSIDILAQLYYVLLSENVDFLDINTYDVLLKRINKQKKLAGSLQSNLKTFLADSHTLVV